jgi:PRTRC genetic system protein B
MLNSYSPDALDCGAARVTPRYALTVSEITTSGQSMFGGRAADMMLTLHQLHTVGGQTRMGSGEVIGPERLADIVDELGERGARRSCGGILPASVVAHGDNMIAWHVPSQRRPMFFSARGDDRKRQTLTVAWPSLLFLARGSSLWLAALDSDSRPDANTPVYHAPLMNHDARNGLCFGSAVTPPHADIDTMATFEAAVFESNFSHVNGDNHLRYKTLRSAEQRPCNETHLAFYQSLSARKLKRFPTRHLLPTGRTVADFLSTGA